MTDMRHIIAHVIGFFTLLYPFAVFFAVQYWPPWVLAVSLAILLILRLLLLSDRNNHLIILMLSIVYCGLAIWNNDQITLRFYPVLINFGLLFVFCLSLYFPPPVIERLARLQHPDLPEQGIRYTRKVTQVWCVFFIMNGMISLATALWSSFAIWSLYNGLIAYVLMAILMGLEYWIRIRTQPHVR